MNSRHPAVASQRDPAAEIEALRQLIREAHEAMRDLRAQLREVRGEKDDFIKHVRTEMEAIARESQKLALEALDKFNADMAHMRPIVFACPACGALNAMLVDTERMNSCGDCGEEFRLVICTENGLTAFR